MGGGEGGGLHAEDDRSSGIGACLTPKAADSYIFVTEAIVRIPVDACCSKGTA